MALNWVYDDLLTEDAFRRVVEGVEYQIDVDEKIENDDSYTEGVFWVPLSQKPSNEIEAFIHHLAYNTPALSQFNLSTMAGAEWWWQEQDLGDEQPKEYHCDEDRYYVKETDEYLVAMPDLASVFYLTDHGGPTVCFGQTKHQSKMTPPIPSVASVCWPVSNRYMLFRGNLFHGVLHSPPEEYGKCRKTLLINWWTSPPPTARQFLTEKRTRMVQQEWFGNGSCRQTLPAVTVRGGEKVGNVDEEKDVHQEKMKSRSSNFKHDIDNWRKHLSPGATSCQVRKSDLEVTIYDHNQDIDFANYKEEEPSSIVQKEWALFLKDEWFTWPVDDVP